MAKLIVERPRKGGGIAFPRGTKEDRRPFEDQPRRERIGARWSVFPKWLNENLAPLRRYLLTNVGRPWDKVFGEICERINFNSAVQLHIWQHVQEYVCRDVVKDGREFTDSRGRRIRHAFFVDPSSGLLKQNEKSGFWQRHKFDWRGNPRSKKQESPRIVRVSDTVERREINGIWYEITFSALPSSREPFYDVLQRCWCDDWRRARLREFYGRAVYASVKRQLCSKEIRRMLVDRPDLKHE